MPSPPKTFFLASTPAAYDKHLRQAVAWSGALLGTLTILGMAHLQAAVMPLCQAVVRNDYAYAVFNAGAEGLAKFIAVGVGMWFWYANRRPPALALYLGIYVGIGSGLAEAVALQDFTHHPWHQAGLLVTIRMTMHGLWGGLIGAACSGLLTRAYHQAWLMTGAALTLHAVWDAWVGFPSEQGYSVRTVAYIVLALSLAFFVRVTQRMDHCPAFPLVSRNRVWGYAATS